ncbi:MAG: molybdopterin-containing oxidoreductase family protein [bacterium JZ-2024 1]
MPATDKEKGMELSRREFLQLSIGTGIAIGVFRRPIQEVLSADHPLPLKQWNVGQEEFFISQCSFCKNSCGFLCRTVDGNVVRLEGNPQSPVNRGSLCPAGIAAVQHLYHPDRLLQPWKRTGARGDLQFSRTTWDDVLALLHNALNPTTHTPKIAWVDDGSSGPLLKSYLYSLLKKLGEVHWLEAQPDPMRMVLKHIQGVEDVEYDLQNARTILSFGYPLLEGGKYPISFMRIFGKRIDTNPFLLIQVEPRFSLTASRAQVWIPVAPNQEANFALALAHVIINEEWYNKEFLQNFSSDFEEFRKLLVQTWTLEELAEACSVPVEKIFSVARTLALQQPSVVIPGDHLFYQKKGFFTVWATYLLNALLGNIGKPGGILRPLPHPLAPVLPHPEEPSRVSPDVVFIGEYDSFFAQNNPELLTWVKNAPLVVQITPLLNDTSSFADLVLPLCTFGESYQENYLTPFGEQIIAVVPPFREPQGESLPIYEILRKILASVNAETENEDFGTYLDRQLRRLFTLGRGTPFSSDEDILSIRSMQERGWWFPVEPDEDAYVEKIWKNGGWIDPLPPYYQMQWNLPQPFLFLPEAIRKILFTEQQKQFSQTPPDREGILVLFAPPLALRETHNHLPWLLEHPSPEVEFSWFPWVEIPVEDARKAGLKEGEEVEIDFGVEKITLRAKISPRIPGGTIFLPLGFGQKEKGRYARGKGRNFAALFQNDPDPITGVPSWCETRILWRKKRKV